MSTPHRCPVCEGRQIVSRWFYEVMPDEVAFREDPENDGDPPDVHEVPCRSCKGTGVVWNPSGDPSGPLRIQGDVVIEGNVVAEGYREWLPREQVARLDVVTGLPSDSDVLSYTMAEQSFSFNYDFSQLGVDHGPWTSTVVSGLSVGSVDSRPSVDATVVRPPDGSTFVLEGCHIEVGERGGGLHIVGDPDRIRAIIRDNLLTHTPGFEGVRIRPKEPETAQVHPERKRVLDLLATLPEDMPLLVLTPRSQKEIRTAYDFAARLRQGTVAERGARSLSTRMHTYAGANVLNEPPEMDARLAGLPIADGDEG